MQREAFLALYLVFIYSYFPDFHALIFDFYNDLAEFYSHTCGFISFSNAVYHAQSLPGRSVWCQLRGANMLGKRLGSLL
ncbi:hypothetical protein CGMCC3_g3823 [Colletotrichum fructicola]|nr:uncharacterized protein CGMCC3_g3823 [Colletotrichum fructicola]KAE9580160.1 hypothetical protein CGMCC3_g3823 [Colletotrichum fructicola]